MAFDDIITDAAQVSREWLEAALRRSGGLREGGILGVDVDSRAETWSNSARLRLHYQPDSSGDLPEALFVKIDRQPFDWSLRVWLGVSDLAYLMCSYWPTEVRRAFEHTMLQRYHAALLRHGIDDYGWDELWNDYRLSAVQAACVAVEWCVLEGDRERMRWLWSVELRRAMDAFADLNCRDLWAGRASAA